MVAVIGPDGGFIDVNPEEAGKLDAMNAANKTEGPAAKPTAPSMMTGSDGKLYNVPAGSYDTAIKNGWKPADQASLDREEQIKRGVDQTSVGAGGIRTFANEASLGILNYVDNKEAGEKQASINEEIRNRVAKRDPITHALSAGAGFAAPMLIPGVGEAGELARGAVLGAGEVAARVAAKGAAEVATKAAADAVVEAAAKAGVQKAAETTLARKIAATAVQGAVEGAVYSAPKAAVQVAYGDTEQAAEGMLWGIGLGAVGGVALGGVEQGVKAGLGKLQEGAESVASKLGETQSNGLTYADDIARNFLGINDKQAQRIGAQKITQFVERADELGILKSGDKVSATKNLLKTSGEGITEHLNNLQEAITKDPELAAKLKSPAQVSEDIQAKAITKFPEIEMATHASEKAELTKILEDVASGGIGKEGAKPSFEALQEIRTSLQKGKKSFMKGTPQAEIYKFADGEIQKALEEGAQAVYAEGANPKAFPDYLQQKFDYHMAKSLLERENPFRGTGRLPSSLDSIFGHGSSTMNSLMVAGAGHPALALGGAAVKYVVSKVLHNEAFLGTGISALRKISKDPASVPIIGGLLAKSGKEALEAHLASIPELIRTIPSKAVARGTYDAVQKFLGPEANGLSKDQQFKRINDKLISMGTNSSATSDAVGHISSVFTGTSLQLAALVADKKMNAISYLQSQLPKNPKGPQPFEKSDWKPSKQEQLAFERKLGVIMNPMSVFSRMHDHTINKDDIDALKAVYPKIYQAMVETAVNASYDPKLADVPHSTRMAVSKLVGMPLDNSIKNIASIQQAIAAKPAGKGGKGSGTKQMGSTPQMKSIGNLTTDVQRRANK